MSNKGYRSRLAKKITLKYLLVESAMIVGLFIIFFAVIIPGYIRSEVEKHSYIAENISVMVDSKMKTIVSYGTNLMLSPEFEELINKYMENEINAEKVSMYLKNTLRMDKCQQIVIRRENSLQYHSLTGGAVSHKEVFEDKRYEEIVNGKKSNVFSEIIIDKERNEYTLAYSRAFYISGNKYIITIFTDVKELIEPIEENAFFSDIIIFDYHGNILYCKEDPGNFKDVNILERKNTYGKFEMSSGFRINVYGNENQSILSCYSSPELFMGNLNINIIYISVVACVLVFACFVILLPMLSKSILPLQKLYISMKRVKEGKGEEPGVIRTNDEIEDLSEMYIDMLDTIRKNTDLIIEKEKEKNILNFSLLVDQIDPHFIFNTMNIISSLARQNRSEEIIKLNGALIKLLQDRLRLSAENIYDTISHELEVLNAYIEIVKLRTMLEVNYTVECTDEERLLEIPKNIIQPFLENSLFHGLYDFDTGVIKGNILIRFESDEEFIYIEITDDGVGFSEESVNKFYSEVPDNSEAYRGKHNGMRNVKKRLELISSDIERPVELSNVSPHGAKVRIKLNRVK